MKRIVKITRVARLHTAFSGSPQFQIDWIEEHGSVQRQGFTDPSVAYDIGGVEMEGRRYNLTTIRVETPKGSVNRITAIERANNE